VCGVIIRGDQIHINLISFLHILYLKQIPDPKALLTEKKNAFRSGIKEELQREQTELRRVVHTAGCISAVNWDQKNHQTHVSQHLTTSCDPLSCTDIKHSFIHRQNDT